MRDYLRVLQEVWKANPRLAALTLFTTVASALMVPAQMWISKVVLDNLTTQVGIAATINWVPILAPIGGFLVLWLVGAISQSASENLKELLGEQGQAQFKYQVLRKASSMSIAYFETPRFFDDMSVAQREVYRVTNVVAQALQAFRYVLSLVATLVLLSRVGLVVPAILLLATLPQLFVRNRFIRDRFALYFGRTTAERKIGYISWLLTAREVVKELRLFQLHNYFLEEFLRSNSLYLGQLRRIILGEERGNAVLSVLAVVGTVIVWLYALQRAVAGQITIGDLALTFQAVELCRSTLTETFFWSGVLFENTLYLRKLFEFLDLPADAIDGALAPQPASGSPTQQYPPFEGGIEFRNVSFHYPGTDTLVLKNLSFSLRLGETVALVGENGAGKTTIVKLIARLYDPVEGEILLDGRDLREYEPSDYYQQLGVIFQDFVRYDLSVAENIGFGQLAAMEDRARIERAAAKGGATELIATLPQGFDTMLGKVFDEGIDLSGGQWQKIALSRAFMRDAPILILDEPTSALDALAEYDIFNRFAELSRGKLTLFISHRLSSVKMADRILFLEEGRLIDQGTHEELLARCAPYATMYTLQAERYK